MSHLPVELLEHFIHLTSHVPGVRRAVAAIAKRYDDGRSPAVTVWHVAEVIPAGKLGNRRWLADTYRSFQPVDSLGSCH